MKRKKYKVLIKCTKVKLKKIFSPTNVLARRMENKVNKAKYIRKCSICKVIKDLSDYHNSSYGRDGKEIICKQCQYNRSLKYRKPKKVIIRKSEEYKAERRRMYREINREKIAEGKRIHRLMNIERYRERDRIYHKENYSYRNEVVRKRRLENYDKCKERRVKNKHNMKVWGHNANIKRKRKICKTNDGTITPSAIKDMLIEQDYKCVECGIDITENYTLDHCESIYDGGSHSIDNIQLMCKMCNCRKNKKSYRVVKGEKVNL